MVGEVVGEEVEEVVAEVVAEAAGLEAEGAGAAAHK